jgi:hypothetical protein
MKGIQMSRAQAEAHQRKHGFVVEYDSKNDQVLFIEKLPKPCMNKTETEYSLILEAMKRREEISRWEFEGITLRWGGLRYTPDFNVFPNMIAIHQPLRFIEVKGGFIREDAMVKFKAAKAHWPEFAFELWQKSGGWRRIY